jgi:hypothetical protein
MLVTIAVMGVLLSGCGPGTATAGPGPASAANPRLNGTGPPQPVPGSAGGVAQAIAARWAAAGGPAPALNTPIEFWTTDYTATVFNPGTPGGFTAFITTRRTILVTPASAAAIDASNGAPARFATPADKALWQAADRPSLGQAPATGQRQVIPAGDYTFLPQGRTLTYRQAAGLPGTSGELAGVILAHLRAYAGRHPPASLTLTQLAYLIATAPLTKAARSAAWQVVGSLPGLRICQTRPGPLQPRTVELCLASGDDETLVSIDLGTASILSISDRLLRSSPMYPHVAAGTIVGSATFVTSGLSEVMGHYL